MKTHLPYRHMVLATLGALLAASAAIAQSTFVSWSSWSVNTFASASAVNPLASFALYPTTQPQFAVQLGQRCEIVYAASSGSTLWPVDRGWTALEATTTFTFSSVPAISWEPVPGTFDPTPLIQASARINWWPADLLDNAQAPVSGSPSGAVQVSVTESNNFVTSSASVNSAMTGNSLTVTSRTSCNGSAASRLVSGGGLVHFKLAFVATEPIDITVTGQTSIPSPGGTQSLPEWPCALLPVPSFCNAPSGRWFDPPLALGYDFQQTGSSLFTDILTLPVGIDGDGLFEVQVGNQSLGQFAQGTGVNFVQLLGNGVPAFRIVGIDPGADATDVEAFPVQLAFNTPTADFTMTPVKWHAIGSSCSDAVCAQCPTTTLAPIGDALEGNLTFGLGITNGPGNGAAGFYVGLGSASPAPIPLFCGSVLLPLQTAFFDVGATVLPGAGTCDGAGSILLPLVPTPPLFGLFLTVQAITLCPQGGLGLTHAIEFPIGN